jgi:hypothetical protein
MARIKSTIRNAEGQLACPRCKAQLYTSENRTKIIDYGLTPNPDFIKFVARCGCHETVSWVRETADLQKRYTEPELSDAEIWAFVPLLMGV